MKTRTVVIGYRDNRTYDEFPDRFKIERPRCGKRIINLIKEGYSLIELGRLSGKDYERIGLTDGMIVQARKMIEESNTFVQNNQLISKGEDK